MKKLISCRISAWSLVLVILCTPIFSTAACTTAQKKEEVKSEPKIEAQVTLATTTSTQDSGLLDVMIPAFEKKFGNQCKVKVVAVGSGQAIQLGKDGNADVLLVHSKKNENEFMTKGYGTEAWDVMYNQFLIVGPKDDPAQIGSAKTVPEAMAKIAAARAKFISRGDNSGTHTKEKGLWDKAKVKPAGIWYVSAGQGMGETIRMADEMGAYTLTDEATFLTGKTKLAVIRQGEKELLNPYGIIKVKSTRKTVAADELISFFVSAEGQQMIGEFGRDKYGKPLFVPSAKKR